jgi:hypothetical protein
MSSLRSVDDLGFKKTQPNFFHAKCAMPRKVRGVFCAFCAFFVVFVSKKDYGYSKKSV